MNCMLNVSFGFRKGILKRRQYMNSRGSSLYSVEENAVVCPHSNTLNALCKKKKKKGKNAHLTAMHVTGPSLNM